MKIEKKQVNASYMKVMDESMSAFCPQTRATGNLPHLSFILHKPESLGTEFKVVACPITGIILFLEIQKGCEAMRQAHYSMECGVMAGCMLRLVEGSKKQHETETRQLYYGDSWFASVTCVTELWKQYDMRFLGMVKTKCLISQKFH